MEVPALEGSQWILATLNGAEPLPDTTITARFEADGVLSGTDGCNRYGAQYEVDGDQLIITPGMGTMMACLEPIMKQATDYMIALESAATHQIQDGTLSGSAGCNSYSAGYEVDGNSITIGLPISTLMACAASVPSWLN